MRVNKLNLGERKEKLRGRKGVEMGKTHIFGERTKEIIDEGRPL